MQNTTSAPRIAFESSGAAGPRLLMVMGFGMRGAVWLPQVQELRRDHTLAWFDNRGIGESEPTPPRFGMADLAADALRVADQLGWSDFHLVGVSLGGMVAQELALLAPGRVRSLTLIATHSGGLLGILPTLRGLYHWINAAFGPQLCRVEHLTRLLYPAAFLATVNPEDLRARMALQVGKKPPTRTALLQLVAVIRHDTRARLTAIRPPTLIIKPMSDLLVRPFHSDRLHAAIPGARLLAIDDAGHGLTFHAAAAVNAAIREHVARNEVGES